MQIEVDVAGLDDLLANVDRLGPAVYQAAAKAVHDTGATLLTQIRANASSAQHEPREVLVRDPTTGKRKKVFKIAPRGHLPGTGPGPNVAFGDYLRSWHLDTGEDGRGPYAVVSTNAPQAMRLEYGFFGTDALGRSYRQPPYPHVRPAIEQIAGPDNKFRQTVRAAIIDALK